MDSKLDPCQKTIFAAQFKLPADLGATLVMAALLVGGEPQAGTGLAFIAVDGGLQLRRQVRRKRIELRRHERRMTLEMATRAAARACQNVQLHFGILAKTAGNCAVMPLHP